MTAQKFVTTKEDAMYHLFVVAPLEEIVQNLKDGVKYRMEFLDEKLAAYMKTAAVSLGYSESMVKESNKPETWNEYAKNYYLKYFEQLLGYFEKQ